MLAVSGVLLDGLAREQPLTGARLLRRRELAGPFPHADGLRTHPTAQRDVECRKRSVVGHAVMLQYVVTFSMVTLRLPQPDERLHAVRHYQIDDEWITETDSRVRRTYPAAGSAELPSQFAATVGSRVRLEQFIETYGRLHFHGTTAQDPFLQKLLTESVAIGNPTMFDRLAPLPAWQRPMVDPTDWTEGHARTVGWLLNAAAAVQAGSTRECARLLTAGPELPYSHLANILYGWTVLGRHQREPARLVLADELARVLTDHTRAVRREFVSLNGRVVSEVSVPCLLNTIYLVIGESLTASQFATCAGCGRAFIKTDGRQRYCPPRFNQDKSACLNRAMVRASRARRR